MYANLSLMTSRQTCDGTLDICLRLIPLVYECGNTGVAGRFLFGPLCLYLQSVRGSVLSILLKENSTHLLVSRFKYNVLWATSQRSGNNAGGGGSLRRCGTAVDTRW